MEWRELVQPQAIFRPPAESMLVHFDAERLTSEVDTEDWFRELETRREAEAVSSESDLDPFGDYGDEEFDAQELAAFGDDDQASASWPMEDRSSLGAVRSVGRRASYLALAPRRHRGTLSRSRT